MLNVVVIGSSNTDMVIKTNRIPIPGETILGGEFFMNPGGKGANQAVAVARLGGNTTFIAKIGKDIFGNESLNGLKAEGINTNFITRTKSKPSGVALITLGSNAENSIVVAPGANICLKKEDIDKAIYEIKKAEVILIQLEIPLKIVNYVIQLGKKHNKKIVLNPAPGQKLNDEFYKSLYAITPNETEAEILTGIKVIDEKTAKIAASILIKKGVENVIITMGAKGAFLLTNELSELIPGQSVKAIDTTAAGDTFNGALALGICSGMGIKKAVKFGNRAASYSVTKLGAQSSIPYLRDFFDITLTKV